MIKITFKDGSIREFKPGISVLDVAKSISEGLARNAMGALVNGELSDLRKTLNNDCSLTIVTFDDEEGKKVFRHTSSHILAQAIKNLYPDAKLAIGPAIENGFYYDFDFSSPFTESDTSKVEAEIKNIVKENSTLEYFELPRAEALKLMNEKNEPYKVELINDLPDGEVISFYKQGDFVDLCAGPHLLSTGSVKAIKILNVAGAYWKGSEKNKMLTRIYATSFPKASMLEEHITMLEEAKKRDHNKLGRELGIFTTSDVVGQGLPLLMPKGAKIVQLLQRFVEDEEYKRGYLLTKTPFMAKKDLYQISGHWDHYKDGMFILGDEETDSEVFGLRPMTCPFQFMIYKNSQKSYKDLPLRYSETSTLFRNEESGEMHGLIRVRQFTISEGHLIVTPEQLEEEFKGVVDLIKYMLDTLGLSDGVSYRFSKWDPNDTHKYINNPDAWEATQNKMRTILQHLNINFKEADGEAAFYGPKLDIQYRNVHGKEDTIITVQIDFALPERFDMYYIDANGEKKRPYVIHRTSIGCYERTLAMLIEKYAGAFPTWIAPVQVKILPISDKFNDYAISIMQMLQTEGVRVELDDRSEKIGYKIREAQLEKVPYMLVVGENEATSSTVSVRKRGEGDIGSKSVNEFVENIMKEIKEKK